MIAAPPSPPLARPVWPIAALAGILAVTAGWWALALWPVEAAAPQWFLRTREVCFGATATGLPNAGGWLLLIGQPAGMLVVLGAVWPAELRAALAGLTRGLAGQLVTGAVAAAVTIGLVSVGVRVVRAGTEPFDPGSAPPTGDALTRLNDAAPAMSLIDQHGQTVGLDAFRGRPAIVGFAYAHCDTVCPLVVAEVLEAQASVADLRPVVLIVTLDPWRDTPSRLPAMAAAWRLTPDAHVLSGPPDQVERTLNAWRIPRARNERTGDLSHPTIVYVLGADGRITFAVPAQAEAIAAAIRAL